MTSRLGRRVQPQQVLRQRGAISLTFVMLLPFMLALLAATTVFAMYVLAVLRIGQASDTASLACAYSQRVDQNVIQGFLDYYRPNFVPHVLYRNSQLTVDKGCKVAAGYAFKPVLVPLLSADNNHELTSNGTAKARLIADVSIKPTDFALALDISGSMTLKVKLPRLKEIVLMAIEEVSYAASLGTVRFSMVSFEKMVGFKNAPWLPESKGKVVCVDGLSYVERNYVKMLDVDKTIDELGEPAAIVTKSLSPPTEIAWRHTCSSSAPTIPLTSDLNQLESRVKNLTANRLSNVFQGLYWGGRTLIPQWQRDWHIEPVTDPGLTQRLVVFTDGGIEHSPDQMITDEHVPICQAFRDKFDIEIVFVGFQIPDGNIEQIKRCAGSDDAVYNAQDEAQLEAYFRRAFQVENHGMKLILED